MKVNTKHACYVIVLSVCNVILYVLFIHQYWFDYSQQLSVILKLHCVILYYVLFGFVPSVVMSPIFYCFFFSLCLLLRRIPGSFLANTLVSRPQIKKQKQKRSLLADSRIIPYV